MPEEKNGSTNASNAGRPITPKKGSPEAMAPRAPSDADLDERNRLKARPRRPAGPPLHDDAADEALRSGRLHNPPPATDPKDH